MIRIAVIEDQEDEANRISSYLKHYSEVKQLDYSLECYDSAEYFLSKYSAQYDLVLMDIMFTGMNGMQAAQCLRNMDEDVTLIFVTNMAQFAVKGYEVNAFDFIVKPVTYAAFAMKMDRVCKKLSHSHDKLVTLKTPDGTVCLPLANVSYVEVVGHKLIYHTAERDYCVYGSMKNAEEQLQSESFARCNSGLLVNLNKVRGINMAEGTVRVGEDSLPISRSRRKGFLDELNHYLGDNI